MSEPSLPRGTWFIAALLLMSGCDTLPPPSAGAPAPAAQAAASAPVSVAAAPAVPAATPPSDMDALLSAPPPVGVVARPTAPAIAVDPLNADEPVNLADADAQADLWARVRRGYAIPNIDNDAVRVHEQFYAQRPDYVRRMVQRGGRYLFHIIEEIERRGMPSELALLPFAESAFNPQAMSSARASGMWQFMPATGKDFDLKQNIFRDDRRDVLASTRAALDYLERLYGMFGDWQLALAAYNWGEGNVQRAIGRNTKAGLPTDFSSLTMPEETRNYVPKLQALENIVARPASYGVELPPLRNHPYFVAVDIERDIDVDLAARMAGITVEEFKHLNPQMNKPVILAAGTPQLLLPYDNAARFANNLESHQGPLASWTAWVTKKTLRPAEAAQQLGVSEAQLRDVNQIPPRMVIKAGSTLLVPRKQTAEDVSVHLADNAMMALAPDAPPMRRVTLRAGKKGETVASVARRYGTSAAKVAEWNRVSASARFSSGTPIVVYLPNKARTTRSATATSGSKAAGAKAPAAKTTRKAAAPAAPRAQATSAKSGRSAAASKTKLATAPGEKTQR